MKKLIIALLIIFVLPSMSYAFDWKDNKFYSFTNIRKWDKEEKELMASFTIGQSINHLQTKEVYRRNFDEICPPTDWLSNKGKNLLEYRVGTTLITWGVSHIFHNHRKPILKFCNSIVWGYVHHDKIYAGIKINL